MNHPSNRALVFTPTPIGVIRDGVRHQRRIIGTENTGGRVGPIPGKFGIFNRFVKPAGAPRIPNPYVPKDVKKNVKEERNLTWIIIWTLTVAVCSSVCAYQIHERIGYFISVPVTANIRIVRNTTVQFPAFTFCPLFAFRYPNLYRLFLKMGLEPNNSRVTVMALVEKGFKNVSEFYDMAYFEGDSAAEYMDFMLLLSLSSQIGGSGSYITPTLRNVSTISGKCLMATFDKPAFYQGPATAFKIFASATSKITEILIGAATDLDKLWMITIHPPEMSSAFTAPVSGFKVFRGHKTAVSLSVKEYKLLNRSNFLCVTQYENDVCRGDCIAKILLPQITCRLPLDFPQLDHVPLCEDYESFKWFFLRSQKVFMEIANISECFTKCPRPCWESVYVTNVQYLAKTDLAANPDYSEILFYFGDNVFEIVEEIYAYGIINLLCDMGGSLGLFLGFSLLTLLDILRSVGRMLK